MSDDHIIPTDEQVERGIKTALETEFDMTPLMEMGAHIAKHGLPNIDRDPSPFWKNHIGESDS